MMNTKHSVLMTSYWQEGHVSVGSMNELTKEQRELKYKDEAH